MKKILAFLLAVSVLAYLGRDQLSAANLGAASAVGTLYSSTTVAGAYALRLTANSARRTVTLQNYSTNRVGVFLGTSTNASWSNGKSGLSLAPLGTQGDRLQLEWQREIILIEPVTISNAVQYLEVTD